MFNALSIDVDSCHDWLGSKMMERDEKDTLSFDDIKSCTVSIVSTLGDY